MPYAGAGAHMPYAGAGAHMPYAGAGAAAAPYGAPPPVQPAAPAVPAGTHMPSKQGSRVRVRGLPGDIEAEEVKQICRVAGYVTMCVLDAEVDAYQTKSALIAYDTAKQAKNAVERLHATKLTSGHLLQVSVEGAVPGARGRPY